MSAAVNTTPIVTTVTKSGNKEKTQTERDKVNIQNFCEEHYEDILPIIIDKVRRDKRKEVHTRLDFEESSETGRGRREGSQNSSPDRAGQALGIRPALEVVPLVEIAPDAEITSVTLKGRTMVYIPPKGLGPSTEDPLEIDVDPGARRDGEKTNPHRPAALKVAPVTRAIGSQEAVGNHRRCGALHKSVDEFYDSEVTIAIGKSINGGLWNERNLEQDTSQRPHGMLKFPG
ncbi:hypothetical protein Tco_1051811 [Tanacetum coccineum]